MATLKLCENFTHDQLDTTQQSIRVISVDPELSPEGLMQCSIHQTTIDANYNCLSYRWGPKGSSQTLVIDGKRLSISQSLHEFLTAVRAFTYRDQLDASCHLRDNLWIDAICIDQNSESEKNHQVAQMGRIYSNATKVVMWLGNNHGKSQEMLSKTTKFDYVGFVWFNGYWTRAWIAQEVMLAKDPVLMIANHLFSFPDFIGGNLNSGKELQKDAPQPWWNGRSVLRAWMKKRSSAGNTTKLRITQWLNELRDVKCMLVHDRIFSLLELAEEGGCIPVDYNMLPVELVYHILKAQDDKVCLCEVFLLNHVLKIQNEAINTSDPCVYVQWKPDPFGRVCHSVIMEKEARFWSELGKMTNDVPKVVQVPLRKLVITRGFMHLCSGATTGKVRIPVQLGHGRVHDWQLVSEDGKVERLHSSFAEAL